MLLEENKAILRKVTEALNKRNFAMVYEFIAPNYFNHAFQLQGLEDFKQHVTTVITGFPNFHLTIEDIIAEGDKVWVRYIETMTHTCEYRGIAPTGEKITFPSVWIHRIVEGKIVEEWAVTDSLDFLKKLGVIEYKGFPDART